MGESLSLPNARLSSRRGPKQDGDFDEIPKIRCFVDVTQLVSTRKRRVGALVLYVSRCCAWLSLVTPGTVYYHLLLTGGALMTSTIEVNCRLFFSCLCCLFQETAGGRRAGSGAAAAARAGGPGADAAERHFRALQVRQLPPVAQGSRTRAARVLPHLQVAYLAQLWASIDRWIFIFMYKHFLYFRS